MWETTKTAETTAAPQAVWSRYEDPTTWPSWNPELVAVDRQGPFATGTTGTVTNEGQPAMPFTLVSVDEGKGFTMETQPGGGLIAQSICSLTPLDNGGTLISHTMRLDGPPADQVGAAQGPAFAASLDKGVKELAELATR
ncbi:SRPBCC family protein [Streptomyces sp. AC512_CC834]|uniref:SRPBCC family protein n=1 Tax=Streptomyces sp. AC512_CC834 TaxID=2823691 RepID=UPI001C25AE45|nr:SRPBCC family protein [Streptomyces sp. AC512_CC834]